MQTHGNTSSHHLGVIRRSKSCRLHCCRSLGSFAGTSVGFVVSRGEEGEKSISSHCFLTVVLQELCRAALLAPVQDLLLAEEEGNGVKKDSLRALTMQVCSTRTSAPR